MTIGLFCLLLFGLPGVSSVAAPPSTAKPETVAVTPMPNAHAHNDYVHARPLLDALANGFCSVEADIHLVNGKLLVAHDLKDVRPDRTLQSLYLEPLRQRAKKNGGRIYASGPVSLTLLIDVKTDAVPTYAALRTVLMQYKEILTEFRADKTTPRAVTVIVSGGRPTVAALAAESPRYAGYDGRLTDLDQGITPEIMPLVSQNWSAVSTWNGAAGVTFPVADRERVTEIVAKAHRQGYRLRFWATPDTPVAWQIMRDLKIDLVNTDDLSGLRHFLQQGTKQP